MLVLFPRNSLIIDKVNGFENLFYDDALQEELILNYQTAFEYLKYLYELYEFNTVLDIGCGACSWLKAADEIIQNQSKKKIVGIEKFYEPDSNLNFHIHNGDFKNYNLNDLNLNIKFDLSICIEVGEHIKPQDSSHLIKSLTSCSDIVIFGSATLRQSGDLHINTNNHQFWINIFKRYDFEMIDIFRAKFWNSDLVPSIIQNTFLFVKNGSNSAIFKNNTSPLVNIIHPKVMNQHDLNDFIDTPVYFKKY